MISRTSMMTAREAPQGSSLVPIGSSRFSAFNIFFWPGEGVFLDRRRPLGDINGKG